MNWAKIFGQLAKVMLLSAVFICVCSLFLDISDSVYRIVQYLFAAVLVLAGIVGSINKPKR